jgi:hypothetical protein
MNVRRRDFSLTSGRPQINLHGDDVILAGVESDHWQFLQMSFKLLVYLEEAVLLLLEISLFISTTSSKSLSSLS